MLLRNIFAVILGLSVAMVIITIGLSLDKSWFDHLKPIPFIHWETVIINAPPDFFIALLFSCGLGSLIGGIVTAIIVSEAKTAYAMLIGFILNFVAILDIIFVPHHPRWYEIAIFFIFFPFTWLGSLLVARVNKK